MGESDEYPINPVILGHTFLQMFQFEYEYIYGCGFVTFIHTRLFCVWTRQKKGKKIHQLQHPGTIKLEEVLRVCCKNRRSLFFLLLIAVVILFTSLCHVPVVRDFLPRRSSDRSQTCPRKRDAVGAGSCRRPSA